MSAIIQSSNSNSSLINTIEASDSVVNNNIYTTPEISPTYASTWAKCEKINGTTKAGSQMSFNLNKYGIIEQVLLCYTKNSADNTGVLPINDIFNVIEKVELLAGSRPVSILTSEDLMAQISDLTSSEQEVVKRTAMNARVAGTGAFNYCIPLTFGFMESIQNQLNSSFLEPLSIRVSWSVHNGNWTTGISNATELITDAFLNIRYKSYPEAATANILASNYNQPELVQVMTRFYDESAITHTATASVAKQKMSIELRNTDCVQDVYIMVRRLHAADTTQGAARTSYFSAPLPILDVKLTASGQTIFDLGEQSLQYMRLQSNGWSCAPIEAVSSDLSGLRNIVKIQVGMYDKSCGCADKITNTMSLREMNATKIEIHFATTDTHVYQLDVVENTTAIYSTSSAVGRLSLALSN